MYCSTCGTAVARDLSYCKRCGAKLGGAASEGGGKPDDLPTESLVWAIVALFVIGLGCSMGLMAVLKNVVGVTAEIILPVFFLCLLLILVIESVFIWLLVDRARRGRSSTPVRLPEPTTKELEAAPARTLAEPRLSVTEHTTRSMAPIYLEREKE